MAQVLLHKASDELEYGPDGLVRFSPRMQRLQRWLEQHTSIRVVDPFECTAKVRSAVDWKHVLKSCTGSLLVRWDACFVDVISSSATPVHWDHPGQAHFTRQGLACTVMVPEQVEGSMHVHAQVIDRLSLCKALQDIEWNGRQIAVVDGVRVTAGLPCHCVLESADFQAIQRILDNSGAVLQNLSTDSNRA